MNRYEAWMLAQPESIARRPLQIGDTVRIVGLGRMNGVIGKIQRAAFHQSWGDWWVDGLYFYSNGTRQAVIPQYTLERVGV